MTGIGTHLAGKPSEAISVFLVTLLLSGFSQPPHVGTAVADGAGQEAKILIDAGHPWRPPFGLDRIGRPLSVVVEISSQRQPQPEYCLVAYLQRKEIRRSVLELTGKLPVTCRVSVEPWPTELVLIAQSANGESVELARRTVERLPFEAEAIARPDTIIHPVDLGTILVPSDWLLLAGGQRGSIEGAAVCRIGDVPGARTTAWFESAPAETTVAQTALVQDRVTRFRLSLPPAPAELQRDVLHVSIDTAAGNRLWHKTISTMVVHRPLKCPEFGAMATRLRYDAPISVRGDDGKFSSMNYAQAWDPKLQDVVVALPNGARFVFWRGSSYVPFWAGRYNTGLSYEWAETSPPADGYTDCVEPLMDKELRYGRVRIVESTPARVHVRWSYESCDFKYKVWGDSAVEDFYFYPDGFGTRVLTLQSEPTGDYELNELIILTPQATYPFSVLPPNLVDILFLDGQKRELTFPFFLAEQGEKIKSRNMPAIYRARLHKAESLAAICFHPLERHVPAVVFAPFWDEGQVVTPTYWGSHWPLARGKTTGSAIDDRVQFTPCHNSVMSWARVRPEPVRMVRLNALDTLGRAKPMVVQTWVWMIGMTDDRDERLLQRARSFSTPPSIRVEGARLEAETYIPERRAIRLIVESDIVTIAIQPDAVCVNPVFELALAAKTLVGVRLADRVLDSNQYAWDGKTLWLDATLTQETQLRLSFGNRSSP